MKEQREGYGPSSLVRRHSGSGVAAVVYTPANPKTSKPALKSYQPPSQPYTGVFHKFAELGSLYTPESPNLTSNPHGNPYSDPSNNPHGS